jgi:dTDP-4-dehydrorhamnose reductase
VYGLKVKLEPETTFVCDRSLDGTKFRSETGFRAPAWPEMIRALHDDPTPYDSWNPASR